MRVAAHDAMSSRSLAPDRHAPAQAGAGLGRARVAGLDIGVMFMGSTLVAPLYGLWREEFGFSELVLTLVYAAYVAGNLAALFLFGRLSDQIGRRRASLPALALGGLAMLVFLAAPSAAWLVVGRVLSGLAIGVATGIGTAWVTELVPGEDKARASAREFGVGSEDLTPSVAPGEGSGLRAFQWRLKYWTSRSCCSACARESNVPRLRRLPVFGSSLRE
jgi:MFS family permease